MGRGANGSDAAGTNEEGETVMNLLNGAGEVVLWCMALVIAAAVAGVAFLWAWDKYTGWKWERRGRK